MATVENGIISLNQYKAAYDARVHESRVENTTLYAVYFRIIRSNDAICGLARANFNTRSTVAGLALDLTFLNSDMAEKFTSTGEMFDGVWNPKYDLTAGTVDNPNMFTLVDGVLKKDDGLHIPDAWLEESADLSSSKILETASR